MNKRKKLRTVLITAGIVILTAVLSYLDILRDWDRSVSDRLNQKASQVNRNIYIIGIDDKTMEKYGMITGWGRKIPGKLVEKLNQNPDARIVQRPKRRLSDNGPGLSAAPGAAAGKRNLLSARSASRRLRSRENSTSPSTAHRSTRQRAPGRVEKRKVSRSQPARPLMACSVS